MVPQLAGLFLLFTLSSGMSYLDFVPGFYPGEKLLWANPPEPLPDTMIPEFAKALEHLAMVEERIQLIFRFLNRPSNHRYMLDYIFLISDFNITEEGLAPYYNRKDGLTAFLRGLEENPQPSTEFLRKIIRDALEDEFGGSQPTENEMKTTTDFSTWSTTDNGEDSRISEDIEPSTEPRIWSAKDNGEDSRSLEDIELSTKFNIWSATDNVEEDSRSSEEIEPSSERTLYRSSEDLEFTVYQPKDEASTSEFKQRVGLPYKNLDSQSKREPIPSEGEPLQAGSIRGIPGVHFPDYDDIPITSFNCADRKYIPGFYADLETGCQVFHVCWPHRRESFLCPVGTTFNQAILTCDYWYSTNCAATPLFHDVNARITETLTESRKPKIKNTVIPKPHSVPLSPVSPIGHPSEQPLPDATPQPMLDLAQILKFLPIKSKVVYPEATAAIEKPLRKLKPVVKPHPKAEVKALKTIASRVINEVLDEAGNLVKGVKPMASRIASVGYLPVKLVHAVKEKPAKPIEKFHSRPVLIPKFVKPASVEAGSIPVKSAVALNTKSKKAPLKQEKKKVPELVMQALEMAGTVFQDILPSTRQSLVESYINSKLKKH